MAGCRAGQKTGQDHGAFLLYPVGKKEVWICFKQGDTKLCFRNIILVAPW